MILDLFFASTTVSTTKSTILQRKKFIIMVDAIFSAKGETDGAQNLPMHIKKTKNHQLKVVLYQHAIKEEVLIDQ